jgi:F420-dependent oxidoreductase-like protein
MSADRLSSDVPSTNPAEVPVRYVLKVRPQEGMPYQRILDYARAAEAAGFDAFFRSDHLRSIRGADMPATEAWTTLAGLARETTTIRLGTLVTPTTFRSPYELAKLVATVDEMSGGRVELGIGAGWYEAEHEPLGLPFPSPVERFERLEEQLEIITALWARERVDFEGRWYRLADAPLQPKPVQQPHPPIIVGGSGRPRGLRIAARFASEFNFDDLPPGRIAEILPRLRSACVEAGRDPDTLAISALTDWPAGSPAEQAEKLAAFERLGLSRLYVDILHGIVGAEEVIAFGRRFNASGAAPER